MLILSFSGRDRLMEMEMRCIMWIEDQLKQSYYYR